jgi:hypothetical protein
MICWRSTPGRLANLPPASARDYESFLMPSITRDDTLRAWASRYARLVWLRCGQNKRRACRVLGISYHTLDSYHSLQEQGVRRAPCPAGQRSASRAGRHHASRCHRTCGVLRISRRVASAIDEAGTGTSPSRSLICAVASPNRRRPRTARRDLGQPGVPQGHSRRRLAFTR